MKTSMQDIAPYQTRDGSLIRELMHPGKQICRNMSLAQASVEPGEETLRHRHNASEEIYHVVCGTGIMTLGKEQFTIIKGDSVCIRPGTSHMVRNNGNETLIILCCCSPPYSHSDTEIL